MAQVRNIFRRLTPRFSLQSLLLLMTCVALGIALRQIRRQIPPMKVEIAALRTELGYLSIVDLDKIAAIQRLTDSPLKWDWRIYLPPGHKYRVRCASGFLPEEYGPTFKAWFALTQTMRDKNTPPDQIPTLQDYWFSQLEARGDVTDISPADL